MSEINQESGEGRNPLSMANPFLPGPSVNAQHVINWLTFLGIAFLGIDVIRTDLIALQTGKRPSHQHIRPNPFRSNGNLYLPDQIRDNEYGMRWDDEGGLMRQEANQKLGISGSRSSALILILPNAQFLWFSERLGLLTNSPWHGGRANWNQSKNHLKIIVVQ